MGFNLVVKLRVSVQIFSFDVPRTSSLSRPLFRASLRRVIGGLLVAVLLGFGVASTHAQSPSPTLDSLTVDRAVDQVLESYPAIEAARRDVEAAAARVGQARSGYWPRVSAVASYRRQDPVPKVTVPGAPTGPGGESRSIGIQPNNLYDGHVEVRQTLYDFGKTGARIDQAEAGRMAAERRVEVERADLAFQVVRAFYTTLLAEARVDVQRDQLDQLKRTLAVVRRQQEGGIATEFEVQSTQTRLSAARSRLTQFRSQRRNQAAELRRLLGTAPDDSLALRGSLRVSTGESSLRPDTLARKALLQHPSVQAAQAQVRAAQRQVRVVDQSDAPTLALTAQGGVKNGYPGDLGEPRLNESVGVSLNVPLFEGFATERQVEEAEAQVQAAEARLADVRRQVGTRVEQAASDLRAQLDRLETTALRVEQARRAAELARTRYEAGTITNLELLDAETALQQARLERTEVRYQVVLGRYALKRAAGTLLPFQPASP